MTARRAVAVLAAVFSIGMGVVGCSGATPATHTATAGARAPVITLDVAPEGQVLPTDFLGLSFEASVLGSDLFDPSRSNLPALMRDLGTGRLRFGGDSVDRVAAWTDNPADPLPAWAHSRITPADLSRLGALTAATGWKVDLGLTLGHPDPAAAADEAAAAVRLIGNGLGTVQIGNEPDLFGQLRPGYDESSYRTDIAAYWAAVVAAAPTATMSGPDTAHPAALAAYAAAGRAGLVSAAADGRARLVVLTQHFYPLTRCGGDAPTIAQLLSASTFNSGARLADTAVAAGHAIGVPVRLDETNSVSCGGQDGVSNTLASALWMVEYLLTLAQRGVGGVGIQGGLAACRGYTPLCVPGAEGAAAGTAPGIDPIADASLGAAVAVDHRLAAQPDFYGLLLVHELEGGRWLPLTTNQPIPAWEAALKMPDGTVRVVIVNPSANAAIDLTIRSLHGTGRANVQWLTGPSLGATSGVTLGGTEVGADGGWRPGAGAPLPTTADGVYVRIPAAAAGLVTMSVGS